MDFSNLWKHCFRFAYASFHTVLNYVAYGQACCQRGGNRLLPAHFLCGISGVLQI